MAEPIPSLSHDQFRRRLRQLGLTQSGFARMVQMDVMTISRWARGVYPVPHWVRLLLDLLAEKKQKDR